MKVEVGSLVKEKEGARSEGLVLESRDVTFLRNGTEMYRTDLLILWPDGTKKLYKSTFLEPIV